MESFSYKNNLMSIQYENLKDYFSKGDLVKLEIMDFSKKDPLGIILNIYKKQIEAGVKERAIWCAEIITAEDRIYNLSLDQISLVNKCHK